MKLLLKYNLVLVLLTLSTTVFAGEKDKVNIKYELPDGWYRAGSDPGKYDMGTDKGGAKDGSNCATIESNAKHIKGFGTLMQTSSPEKFKGKRVRMTGYMKSEHVDGWAGFWLRVDKKNGQGSSAFDNMSKRPVKGNTEWTKYDIVLDVDENAADIAYGALLSGTGQIWFDKITFEIVDATTPSTDIKVKKEEPVNLSFDE
ncbi:MAG: hypothetical protein KDC07_01485 [Chitinophagaceae bacterium]|nr:hypothetical protein [Chitinophagaceae bacterium]MCB9046189.1 hypothetical protein [Chitinophagales bacterium]